MKMPTILISNNTVKGYAGSELATLELAAEFTHRGYEVSIATFGKDAVVVKAFDDLNVKWIDLNIEQTIHENTVFDLIWAHHFTTLDAILIDMKITANAIIFSSMSPYEPLEAPPTYAAQLSLILANSDETKRKLLSYGLPEKIIHIFPNPVAKEWFKHSNSPSNKKLTKLAIVSNHVADELKEAIKHLETRGVAVEIFGIEHSYRHVTPELLADFDCVITIGRTVQQAMVFGLPIYCYDRFGGPGYIKIENVEKACAFNYSGRCCEIVKTPENIADEVIDGYQSSLAEIPKLKKFAREKYRLDSAIDQVLKIIDNDNVELKNLSTALQLPARMRAQAKNSKIDQLFAQLFLDYGNGFSESTSLKTSLNQIQNSGISSELYFEIPQEQSLINLRLDPINKCSVIKIHRVELFRKEGATELTACIKSNAKYNSDNTHYFTTNDPQITFENVDFNGSKKINISLTYQAIESEDLLASIARHEAHISGGPDRSAADKNLEKISALIIDQQKTTFRAVKDELTALANDVVSACRESGKSNQDGLAHQQSSLAHLIESNQKLETHLLDSAEREKALSSQLEMLIEKYEEQKDVQRRHSVEQQQIYLTHLEQARKQIQGHLIDIAELEKTFAAKLQDLHAAHDVERRTQHDQFAEQEKILHAQLKDAHQKIEAHLILLTEQEKSHASQLDKEKQKIEIHLMGLAKREKYFSEQLQKNLQAYEQQSRVQYQQHAEQEKALIDQLNAKQQELLNQTNQLAKTKAEHAIAIGELQDELNNMRSTASWRWTAPLRRIPKAFVKK